MSGTVAAIQMVSSNDLKENLKSAARLLEKSSSHGCRLAVLPENFALFSTKDLRSLGEQEYAKCTVQRFLEQYSRQLGMWVVGGTTPVIRRPDGGSVSDKKVRAACFVYSDEGKQVARYDKIHLFDVEVNDAQGSYRESSIMEAGSAVVVVDTPVGRLGLSVCYDVRFAELYSALADQGVEIFSIPSAFTARTGAAHWAVLLRARAIENLCYVIAADQGGQNTPKRETHGESMIVDPWGIVLDSVAKGEGLAIAEVSLKRVRELRRQIPVFEHKRFIAQAKTHP